MFNSSRMQQKSDNSGNVPSIFSRMAPGFASQPPPRHMSRSMHRALSPQRAPSKGAPPVNPHTRGKTGLSLNKASSEKRSIPSGSFKKSIAPKIPVSRAAEKQVPERLSIRRTSPSNTAMRCGSEVIREAGLEKAVSPKNTHGKSASVAAPENVELEKRALARNISRAASESAKSPATKSAAARDEVMHSVEKRSPQVTSEKERSSPSASSLRAPPSRTFSSPDPAKFVRRSPLPDPAKSVRRSPFPEPAKSVNRSPLLDSARSTRRSPLASVPLTSTSLMLGKAQVRSSPLPSLRSSPVPKLPLSKPYVPPLEGDMSTTAELSPQDRASPVPKATSPVPEAMSPIPKATPPVPAATSPIPKATSLVPTATSPVPKATSPAPKAASPVPKTSSPMHMESAEPASPVFRASSPARKSRSPSPSLPAPVVALPAPDLVAAIGEVDSAMTALRRKIANKKARILGVANEEQSPPKTADDKQNGDSDPPDTSPNGLPGHVSKEFKERIAEAASLSAHRANDTERVNIDYTSPIHGGLARILNSNRAKARAAVDVFRSLCHDPEQGLNSAPIARTPVCNVFGEDVVDKIRDVIQKRQLEDAERRRSLAKEYVGMKHAWRRRLKSVRDKRSKEKREASRDRDRYLLVHTRGASALLTCKTSSGRTSTKVLPGVTPGGSLNNMAEIDSMLADIEHAGGTPGSHHIWGKTLADIPVQDPNHVPFDSGNLLIDDPIAELHAARCVSPWTREEKLIFLDKYLLYQKNFRKISTFLEHKNTMDCVRFYFDHKLLYDLKQLLRDSSSMKRKGTRGMHLLNLVGLPPTRRSMNICGMDANGTVGSPVPDSEALTQAGASSMKHGTVSGDKPKLQTPGESDAHGEPSKNRELPGAGIHNPEKTAIDLSPAERDSFCEALASHGTNWQAISEAYNFFGKDSAKLEEYFHRNKQQFNFLAYIEKNEKKSLAGADPVSDNEALSAGLTSRSVRNTGADAKSTSGVFTERGDPQSGARFSTWKGSGCSSAPDESERSSQKPSILEASGTVPQGSGLEAFEKPTKPKATWTAEEMDEFEHHYRVVGKDFKKIASLMDKKTPEQVKGYWKVTVRQEREKSSKKKHRVRTNSDQASPQHSRDGAARYGSAVGGRKMHRESERDSRKRDADEARLADQRGGHEKRERLSDVSRKVDRDHGKVSVDGHGEKSNAGRDGLTESLHRAGASPENRKHLLEANRPPLRSQAVAISGAEGGGNSTTASPTDSRDRDLVKSSRN